MPVPIPNIILAAIDIISKVKESSILYDHPKITCEKADKNKPYTTNFFFIPGLDIYFAIAIEVINRPTEWALNMNPIEIYDIPYLFLAN